MHSGLYEKFKGRDVICISHGGVIRAALTIALKIEAEELSPSQSTIYQLQ